MSRPRRSKKHRPAGYTAERARFWAVDVRTMQRMLNRSLPVDDPARMLLWYSSLTSAEQNKLAPTLRVRLTELRIEHEKQAGVSSVDPDLAAFREQRQAGGANDNTTLATLREKRDFYLFKIERAEARGDQAAVGDATRQLAQFAGIIHDAELRALKAGRDLDDLIPKRDVEHLARHLAFNLLRCADALIAEITAALTTGDLTAARLTAEEIRARVEPLLVSAYVLRPIERAAAGDHAAAPPEWLVKALLSGVAEVLELPAKPPAPAAPAP